MVDVLKRRIVKAAMTDEVAKRIRANDRKVVSGLRSINDGYRTGAQFRGMAVVTCSRGAFDRRKVATGQRRQDEVARLASPSLRLGDRRDIRRDEEEHRGILHSRVSGYERII